MKILYLESLASTQEYLKELVREQKVNSPYAVVTDFQSNGIGSRGNEWKSIKGNLFLSFCIPLKDLPNDLKLESSSIYFAYLLKETLSEFNSRVWIKWPNDFYLDNLKLGGMISNVSNNHLICGVGINLLNAPEGFAKLDIKINKEILLQNYFTKIKKNISWKQVFSKYELEFHRSKKFFTHQGNLKISLKDATLLTDGSITINDKRMYSLR